MRKNKKTHIIVPVFFSFVVIFIIILMYNLNIKAFRKREVSTKLEIISAYQVGEKIQSIQFLSSVWDTIIEANDGEVVDFSNRTEKIIDNFNNAAVYSLGLAPEGDLNYVYPYGSSEYLGENLFDISGIEELLNKAEYTGLDSISAPEDTGDGDYRMTIFHPVYLKDAVGKQDFWGFCIVTLSASELFADIGLEDLGQTVDYMLCRLDMNDEKQVLLSTTNISLVDPVDYYFSVPNGVCVLSASWSGGWIKRSEYIAEIIITFSVILLIVLSFMILKFRSNVRSLSEISYEDELTGLRNRHKLRDVFDELCLNRHHISVAFVDIDHFKSVNDIEGHEAGDEALRQAAEYLVKSFGRDSCYRYGGDEFLVLIADVEDTLTKGEFQRLHGFRKFNFQGREIPVTLSAGYVIGDISTAEELRFLIRRADVCLYRAKKQGRDQICGEE